MSLKLDWRSLQIGKSVGPEFETPIYFFDPSDADSLTIVDPEAATKLIAGWKNSATGSNALLPLELEQNTSNDQPVWDGVKKITFADTSDFMALEPPAITQGGWLIVGTSVGTFTYRINDDALTNVNLLGRVAHTSTPGDLYGMMLIPATSDQFVIEQARQRFINAGAADGVVGTSVANYWRERTDILEFGFVDTSEVTIFSQTWRLCTSLTSFPLLDVSSGTNFNGAFFSCSGLTSFPILNFSEGLTFRDTWEKCSGLTTFPLINVSKGTDFANCWRECTSLTSFPLLDVSKGTNFLNAWFSCTSLTSFPPNFFDGCAARNFTSAFISTALSQTSIDGILVSIESNGTSNGTFNQSGGSAPSATGEDAIDALRARGWTVTVTGGY